jgi:hypothetical protein
MAIEKGANCLINIAIDLIPAGFEFYLNPLTLTDQFRHLLYADVHTEALLLYQNKNIHKLFTIKTFCSKNINNIQGLPHNLG